MCVSVRVTDVLTGLNLALGGVSCTAPAARADIPAVTNTVRQSGAEFPDAVGAACTQGVHGGPKGRVSAPTGAGVAGGTAGGACLPAADPP
ncbi:hypothetical protein [Streptomyces sp. NPDC058964]|uniref:hypothetical protein n=1 Tax=Streptomyces sp. NPDC058964 TaxID=3346681 RepID=UPI0036761966